MLVLLRPTRAAARAAACYMLLLRVPTLRAGARTRADTVRVRVRMRVRVRVRASACCTHSAPFTG